MKVTATLKGAYIRDFGPWARLVGYVFGDTMDRFLDGELIGTSKIVYMCGNYAITRNSVYKVEW